MTAIVYTKKSQKNSDSSPDDRLQSTNSGMGMKTKKAKATAPSKKKSTPRVSGRTSDKAVVKYDPLQRYLSEISRYNLLTREEEVSLGKRCRSKATKTLPIDW
jgi:DNA-directed RNA polymerase sigma subunit (sigma70/sigma32)